MNETQLTSANKFEPYEKWVVFGFLLLYLVLAAFWHFHTNAPWDDDCVVRYYNARAALGDPSQFISLWNRPLFMLLFTIPFLLGKNAILLMAVISASSAYALYRVAKELKIANAFMVVPVLLFQCYFFTVSRSALAEPLAAAIISFSYLFYLRKKFLPFAILGGLLPLARLELSVLLAIWAYILLVNKQQKYIIFLIVPCILWSITGTIIDGGILWLYDQTAGKDNATNMYGHTTFGHYFQRYIYIIGPFLFYFFFIGLLERLYKRKNDAFLTGLFALGFMVYVVFSWKLNLGQAAGFLRHMVVISPLATLLGLYGFNYWIDSVATPKSATTPAPTVKATVSGGKTLQQRIDEIQKKGEQDNLKPKQIRHLINAERAKDQNQKSTVIRTKQNQKSNYDETKFTKYRILFYSLLMVGMAFLWFSKELLGHHRLSEIKDYTNVIVMGSLTLAFIILMIVFHKRTMISAVRFGLAFIVIGCITGYTLLTEPPDSHDSPERKTMVEVSDIYAKSYLKNYPTYANHIWFFWPNDIDKRAKQFKLVTQENLNLAPDSSIIVWESHYSNRLAGNVDFSFFQQKPEYVQLFRKSSSDNKFNIVVFQKIKQPSAQGMLNIYDRLIASAPNMATIYFNRGNLQFNNFNNFDAAIKDYSKAVEIDTNDIDSYYNRGLAFLNLKKYNDAINSYTKIIQLRADYDLAYFNRAMAYSNVNDPNKALADYSKVIELKPGNTQAYYNRGMIYMQQGQIPNGCKDMQKALELGQPQAKASLDQYCK